MPHESASCEAGSSSNPHGGKHKKKISVAKEDLKCVFSIKYLNLCQIF
jgi:hypothetical protein